LPDGGIVDANEYYDLLDVVKDSYIRVAHKTRSSSGGVGITKTHGHSWEVRNSETARAYKLLSPRGGGAPASYLFGSNASRARSLLSYSIDATTKFCILVDETTVDKYTRSDEAEHNGHYTEVLKEYADGITMFKVRRVGSGRESAVCVKVPPGVDTKGGYLPGRFALVPNRNLEHPETGRPPQGTAADSDTRENDTVFDYVALPHSLTPEELLEAWTAKRLTLQEWTFRKDGDRIIWKQRELSPPPIAPG